MRRAEWVSAQEELRAEALAVARGGAGLARLLRAWPVPLDEGLAAALVGELDPPDSPEMARLVAWLEGRPPEAEDDRPRLAWDRLVLVEPGVDSTPEEPVAPSRRRAAALALLARLGEEYRAREHEAPERVSWAASPEDSEMRKAWGALLTEPTSVAAGEVLRGRYRGVVRSAFAGVATALRLPPEVADDVGRRAVEQLDLVFPVARAELAAWVIETAGEPVAALARGLGARGSARVRACVEGRAPWLEVREMLGLPDEMSALPAGVAAVVLRRLARRLGEGSAPAHELGLPGWGVVAANRARVRGRLRAAVALDPGRAREVLLQMDALHARSANGIGRFAWGWAWREARQGFGLDLDRALAPPCEVGPPVSVRPAPLGQAEAPAVTTLLLLVAGRGCWGDLERWVEGAGGRQLGRAFYRCLEAAPDALVDPGTGERRARGYERLREHLAEGGLEAALPTIAAAASRVSGLTRGRDLRAKLREALAPWWDEEVMPFPQHHLPGFVEALLVYRS